MGTSTRPVLLTLPTSEKIFVPFDFSVPTFVNSTAPFLMINGTLAQDSTLFRTVGLSYKPLVAVCTYLAKKGYDPRFGARPLGRVLQTEIKDIIADQLLFGKLEKGGAVFVDLKKDKLTFKYQ